MHRRRTGLTLAELVLALAITSVIGLAVAGVSSAIGNVSERADAYYEYLQSGRVATSKIEQMLRPALLVTAASESKMVVWMNDDYDPGQINASEIAQIYLDTSTHELLEITTEFSDSLNNNQIQALDVVINLSDVTSLSSLDLGIGHDTYDVTRVLARNVQSFEITPDTAAPLTRLVKFKLVIGDGDQTVTQYGAITLRAPSTESVAVQDGKYILK